MNGPWENAYEGALLRIYGRVHLEKDNRWIQASIFHRTPQLRPALINIDPPPPAPLNPYPDVTDMLPLSPDDASPILTFIV